MAMVMESSSPEKRERTFFVCMALLIAATIVAGFGSWALHGHIIQPVPLLVHGHALLFVSWVAIFIAQTTLIQRNMVKYHHRLGWLALGVAGAMLIVGLLTALESVQLGRVPPFFSPGIFLALSALELVCFVVLVTAAILLRGHTAWHRRLILGAMIVLIGPAWGRMLRMEVLGPFAGLAVMAALLVYVAIAAGFDLRLRGKVHPAYYWVTLAVLIEGIGPGPLGMSEPFQQLAKTLAPH